MPEPHPSLVRIWLYTAKSYAVFNPGAEVEPDWLWRSRKFFDWIRQGLLVASRDPEGDIITSPERTGTAGTLGCWWFALDVVSTDSKVRVYALIPKDRIGEVREALGIREPATA